MMALKRVFPSQPREDLPGGLVELDHTFRIQNYIGLLRLLPLQAKQGSDVRDAVVGEMCAHRSQGTTLKYGGR